MGRFDIRGFGRFPFNTEYALARGIECVMKSYWVSLDKKIVRKIDIFSRILANHFQD